MVPLGDASSRAFPLFLRKLGDGCTGEGETGAADPGDTVVLALLRRVENRPVFVLGNQLFFVSFTLAPTHLFVSRSSRPRRSILSPSSSCGLVEGSLLRFGVVSELSKFWFFFQALTPTLRGSPCCFAHQVFVERHRCLSHCWCHFGTFQF